MKRITHWKRFYRYAIPTSGILLVLATALVLNSTSAGLAAPLSGQMEARSVIPGQVVSLLKQRTPVHTTEDSTELELSIALKTRNTATLDTLIAEQNDPRSPMYHQYITPHEFRDTFGPEQSTVDEVVKYLRSQNLQVRSVSPNRLLINVTGPVAQVEHAFNVTLADYTYNGRTVYAPTSEPSVPTALAGAILNVGGLDNVAHFQRTSSLSTRQPANPHVDPKKGYTPAELRAAYNLDPLHRQGYDGSGQTIAIFELDGYNPSDINTFLNHYKLGKPKYSNVLLDGATNTPREGAIEAELDMEIASAIAPGAAQKIYIGKNSVSGVNNLYNRIVTDNIAKVVSISWGLCEPAIGSAELNTLNTFFKQGVAQGQAFFAASGDFGAYDCGNSELAVDTPASDPHVVGVGGTTLQVNNRDRNEQAWSCRTCASGPPGGKGIGGGGGFSSFFPRPAYQNMLDLPQDSHNIAQKKRVVPDVSANANPDTGYSVYCTVAAAGCPSSGWISVGGTSSAAPLWAGTATILNQYLAAQKKPTLGSASAMLYELHHTPQTYAPYHDIQSGDNLYYPAKKGYDLSTGIGTPDAWNMARNLAKVSEEGEEEEEENE